MKAKVILPVLSTVVPVVVVAACVFHVGQFSVHPSSVPAKSSTASSTVHTSTDQTLAISHASSAPQVSVRTVNAPHFTASQANPPAHAATEATNTNSVQSNVTTEAEAANMVITMYKQKLKTIPHSYAVFDHMTTDKDTGKPVYLIHVLQDFSDHVATIAWIGVRSDGMVQDYLFMTGWTQPSKFQVQ